VASGWDKGEARSLVLPIAEQRQEPLWTVHAGLDTLP
jgi:hypothetical protein